MKKMIVLVFVSAVMFFISKNVLAGGCGCGYENDGVSKMEGCSMSDSRLSDSKLSDSGHKQSLSGKKDSNPKSQKICPVMGNEIDKNIYVDYKGKRIYFCCSGCPDEFNKNPEKYMEILEKDGIELEASPAKSEQGKSSVKPKIKLQTTCPVMEGNKINKNIYTDYKGKRIYFCCKGCPEIFKKNPEKYIKKMEKEGITLEDVPKKK